MASHRFAVVATALTTLAAGLTVVPAQAALTAECGPSLTASGLRVERSRIIARFSWDTCGATNYVLVVRLTKHGSSETERVEANMRPRGSGVPVDFACRGDGAYDLRAVMGPAGGEAVAGTSYLNWKTTAC